MSRTRLTNTRRVEVHQRAYALMYWATKNKLYIIQNIHWDFCLRDAVLREAYDREVHPHLWRKEV